LQNARPENDFSKRDVILNDLSRLIAKQAKLWNPNVFIDCKLESQANVLPVRH
jgi:hypothetical protein